ncbi:MAG: hypothetical protein LBQ68_04690, partial [Clostridiales bacterium]|nr:hypothetical protein [Clostridiales bacterium]
MSNNKPQESKAKESKAQIKYPLAEAYQRALNYLSYKALSELQIKKKLAVHYPDDIINQTIELLKYYHFLNDDT